MWNIFDDHYRPEMRIMERGLVLAQLDSTWKNHLYVMDHLRSTVGLRGYAQEDPKTVYKREGMKEFEAMWEGVEERVSEIVFRMEDADEVQDTVWVIGSATHESAPRLQAPEAQSNGAPEEIKQEIEAIKDILFSFNIENAEEFSRQLNQIQDRTTVLALKKALADARMQGSRNADVLRVLLEDLGKVRNALNSSDPASEPPPPHY